MNAPDAKVDSDGGCCTLPVADGIRLMGVLYVCCCCCCCP